ncbi:MAG: N-(5'-phosphoribosyl)anthranilate isomerase [Pyrobaculum sp.]
MLVKICGITRQIDVEILDGRVEYLGFIIEPTSPRTVTKEQLKTLRTAVQKSTPVLVTATIPPTTAVDIAAETEIPVLQHHGHLDITHYDYATARGIRIAPVATYKPGTDLRQIVERLLKTPHEYVLVDADKKQKEKYEGGLKVPLTAMRQVAHLGKVALAGGITPNNAHLVAQLKPYMVDIASGVEKKPGEKDPHLIEKLLKTLFQSSF